MQKMKTNHLIYLLSLIMLIGSIFIVLEYKDSQRMQMLAGFMIIIGIAMNITGFAMKKR
jgi:membrane-bound ClpP family serine protease